MEFFRKILAGNGVIADDEYIVRVLEKIRDRMVLLTDFWQHSLYFFKKPDSYNSELLNKFRVPEAATWLNKIISEIAEIQDWKAQNIENAIKQQIQENNMNTGKVFNLIRIALTGTNQGIGIAEIIELLGKENTLGRIEKLARILVN
jgi:glutamyl-tRNA synthetase